MLKNVKVVIQNGKHVDGQDWIRIMMNETIVVEGKKITPQDLKELFSDMGCNCRLQHGQFTDGVDDMGDTAFEVHQEVL